MECPVLILKTRRMNLMMKDDAVKHISNSMTKFIEDHQGYAPEVLVNPTTEEEIKAMKKHGIELCVGGMENNMFEYLRNGIKLFDMRRMMQISKMGFNNSVNIARETYKIISKEPKSHLLLGNIDYSMQNPSLSNYWADIVDIFQTCWNCDCKD
jgi:nitrogenase molybdenum-cofactor synthesis protein NifE